jgi:hypothetical protein
MSLPSVPEGQAQPVDMETPRDAILLRAFIGEADQSAGREWPDVITVLLRSLTQHWYGKLVTSHCLAMIAAEQQRCVG